MYCDEIKYCLNAETLEEQEPEDGLEQFVEDMWEANDRDVFAPMKHGMIQWYALQQKPFMNTETERQ